MAKPEPSTPNDTDLWQPSGQSAACGLGEVALLAPCVEQAPAVRVRLEAEARMGVQIFGHESLRFL